MGLRPENSSQKKKKMAKKQLQNCSSFLTAREMEKNVKIPPYGSQNVKANTTTDN